MHPEKLSGTGTGTGTHTVAHGDPEKDWTSRHSPRARNKMTVYAIYSPTILTTAHSTYRHISIGEYEKLMCVGGEKILI